jgi:2-phosphosulfolactate phosphatase
MSRQVFVHLLPVLFEPADLQGGVAVVIDVLRATSTIIHALAAGAECVVPCGEIDEARRVAVQSPAGTVLLGGERGGLKVSGFDLGNSPVEYDSGKVRGKRIVMSTTNGTRAMIRARGARRVLIAALINSTAAAQMLACESGPVHFVCAGTDGHITLEDVLCAGGIARRLGLAGGDFDTNDDATQLALNLYETCGRDYDLALHVLRSSRGGRNLMDCGLGSDIAVCAKENRFAIVPELFGDSWEIRIAGNRP